VAEPRGAAEDRGAGSPEKTEPPSLRKTKEESDETPVLSPSDGDDAAEAPSPTEEAPSDSQPGKRDSSGSGSFTSGSSNSGSGNRSDTQQLDESGSQNPKSGKKFQ
jgi:hypothetical protein